MSIIEIVTRLGLIQIAMSSNEKFITDPELVKNIIALKRAMQILVGLDLKNEMENIENDT